MDNHFRMFPEMLDRVGVRVQGCSELCLMHCFGHENMAAEPVAQCEVQSALIGP